MRGSSLLFFSGGRGTLTRFRRAALSNPLPRGLAFIASHADGPTGSPPAQTTAMTSSLSSSSTLTVPLTDVYHHSLLEELLNPPETIPLVDCTRTYRFMDLESDCPRYHPNEEMMVEEEAPLTSMSDEESSSRSEEGVVYKSWAAGELWKFMQLQGHALHASGAPEWFYSLCYDLYHRTDSSNQTTKGKEDAQSAYADEAADTEPRDPYLFLPVELFDEAKYLVGPFRFPSADPFSAEERTSLCLGMPEREYVCFALTYPFPARHQLPTSLGTLPSRLYIDPAQPTPVVYLQLDLSHPPALWLPMKPTAASVRRVLSGFAAQAALHRDRHHSRWAQRLSDAERLVEVQGIQRESEHASPTAAAAPAPGCSNHKDEDASAVLRMASYLSRHVLYSDVVDEVLPEYEVEQNFFLGEFENPEEEVVRYFDLCPALFSMAEMRCVADLNAPHTVPTIEGPGVAISLYRCRYSKALIQITVQLSAEVKLPPLDMEAFQFMWKDAQAVPKLRIPVFARILWPADQLALSGGGRVLQRWNRLFQTEFAPDMPVDAMFALFYAMKCAKSDVSAASERHTGVLGMRQRMRTLLLSGGYYGPPIKEGEGSSGQALLPPELLYPSTAEIPNPEYNLEERIALGLIEWSHVDMPEELSKTIEALLPVASAPLRMGCAKAALIAGDRELFRRIVSREPPGRMQVYMTKLVRKRKSRDLTDPVPRLAEDQFEFAAPLWTTRRTRLDPNTLEGRLDIERRRSGGP